MKAKISITRKLELKCFISFAIMICSSFEIVGVFNCGGMNFKIANFLTILGCFLLLYNRRIRIPVGFHFFFVWLLFQLVYIVNSPNVKFGLGYFVWLIMDAFIIILFQNTFLTKKAISLLFRLYIYSFCLMSFVGVIQCFLALLGIDFYLTQPNLNGSNIPRLNGFCYEPSYYATYLLPGWVMLMYLFEKGSVLFSKKEILRYLFLVSFALFFCTSRMGWLFMASYVAIRILILLFGNFIFNKSLKNKEVWFVVGIIIVGVLIAIFMTNIVGKYGINMLIAGLGIGGVSSHSSGARIEEFINTFLLFWDHPFWGYSLGGVSAKYCETYGLAFASGASMCVWIELLVASGIFGIIPFILWIGSLIRQTYTALKNRAYFFNRETAAIMWAFVFECLILAMNQNILRIYFWVLVAVMNAACVFYKRERRDNQCEFERRIYEGNC